MARPPVSACSGWTPAWTLARCARRRVGRGFRPRSILEWIRRAGGAPSTEGNDPLGHRLWIQHEEPQLYADTATFLEPLDYLNARFTGRARPPDIDAVVWLTDNRRLGQLDYDPVLVRLAAADAGRLPPLVPTGSTVGTVTQQVAEELGLPGPAGAHRAARPSVGHARHRRMT
ncbi:MAG: FGGY family carbohydrate kinase [Microthrixaceae bacterium]